MTTYVVRRVEGQRTPLSDLMQGMEPLPVPVPEPKHYEAKANGARGPVRSLLRRQLEAMAVGDEIETHDRTASQVSAIAFHVRRRIPEARFSARGVGTWTKVRRIA